MFNIGYIIPVVMSCHLLFLELLKYKKEEVSKNIIHFILGIIFILYHNYSNDMVYMTHVSIGFYVYDVIYLFATVLNFKDKMAQQVPYFIHHIITIAILHSSLYNVYFLLLLDGYYILEMSNMMLYISYHIHKEYKNYKLIYIIDFIQLIWYSYYRIIKILVLSYISIDKILELKASLCIMLFIVFLMGVSWSYNLVIKNINNFRSYKTLKH